MSIGTALELEDVVIAVYSALDDALAEAGIPTYCLISLTTYTRIVCRFV
jgi:hypothetical protein